MKEPQPDQPYINLIRLPDTQADGDSQRPLRRSVDNEPQGSPSVNEKKQDSAETARGEAPFSIWSPGASPTPNPTPSPNGRRPEHLIADDDAFGGACGREPPGRGADNAGPIRRAHSTIRANNSNSRAGAGSESSATLPVSAATATAPIAVADARSRPVLEGRTAAPSPLLPQDVASVLPEKDAWRDMGQKGPGAAPSSTTQTERTEAEKADAPALDGHALGGFPTASVGTGAVESIGPDGSGAGPGAGPGAGAGNTHPAADTDAGAGHTADGDGKGAAGVWAQIPLLFARFVATTRRILLYSWLNVLLVFVPVGIAVACVPDMSPVVVFSMNAVAIVPLAGLLALATESVAHRMGDSIGALLNVTFGNAVELIIFIIALVKNEIRIVQASLLGSILANLLLILGMGFLLGGLRFREQIYNSTVTQMSACLLSLSVISLVLPTAFHASFSDNAKADAESLKISRGTSVILLLVYGIYLLFQLKSHAYMYESTPQYIIDEEATPGPAAAWLDSSSSDDSSSSSSDSDSSGHSRDTMKKRVRRVIRGGRRRKSSVASVDTADGFFGGSTRSPSFGTTAVGSDDPRADDATPPALASTLAAMNASEEAVDEEETLHRRHRKHHYRRSLRRHHRKHRNSMRMGLSEHDAATEDTILEGLETADLGHDAGFAQAGESSAGTSPVWTQSGQSVSRSTPAHGEPRRVDFAISQGPPNGHLGDGQGGGGMGDPGAASAAALALRAFNLRAMSLRPVAKSLAPPVFAQVADSTAAAAVAQSGPIPRVRYGIRRTNSLPDQLNMNANRSAGQNRALLQLRAPGAMLPSQIAAAQLRALTDGASGGDGSGEDGDGGHADKDGELTLSRRAAVLMLLVSTGLVATCAEFMVDSINGLVATSSVGETFIGLIILPIVGNAAEHVTAVMVAMKNKMDLAIGVAVGSSIQIALFMTPLVVILGWIMERDMTLYFTLFETVCLFVSAFIVNFLVLDGRSNYLEGALLCATYVIISLVAFYYPDATEASAWG